MMTQLGCVQCAYKVRVLNVCFHKKLDKKLVKRVRLSGVNIVRHTVAVKL